MAWQEDLAELDRTLAEGRISADDYRRRRDELLASASGAAPQQPPQGNGPFGAPFRWEASQPPQGGPNPDATQVVTPGQPPVPPPNPDATQVVSSPRPPDAERTQYVRPVAPPPNQLPPQQQQQQQQPPQGGWGGGAPPNTPPWGNDQGFGVVGEQTPSWIAQGPEVFDESSGGGGKKWLAIVGVVLVLALVGGGIWFFTTRDGGTTAGGETTQTTAPPTTTTTKPKDGLEIAKLPGVSQDQSGVKNFADVVSGKLLTAEENEALQASGAGRSRLGGSVVSGGTLYTQVLTVRTNGATEAKTARDALGVLQAKYALQPYTGTLPTGVTAFQAAPAGNTLGVVRAHYISKDVVVRVQVTGKDFAQVTKAFDELLEAQLEQLAVDA
ncbi:hypothetical protein [Actinosynnema sp. NPDC023587]|uniref:hypothetical protein n=1 Tax=Actinosynnema sp. NPDC023587 TaxID=3154695 RepID=UPI0033C02322